MELMYSVFYFSIVLCSIMNCGSDAYELSFFTKTSCIQLFYGTWVNLSSMAIGLAYGFPAVQIPQLNAPNSPILLTIQDISWIASVLSLFCPIGCMLSGFLMDKIGRSKVIITCQIPMLFGWLYTGVSRSANNIIIGRAITGFGCGMAMGPPRLYTAEISLPNMRGLLGGLLNASVSLGITLQAIMGSIFDWEKLCYMCAIYNLLLFLSYFFLHETPYYLLMKDTTEHATKGLACFRAKNYRIDVEMNQIIKFKQKNDIRSLNFFENIKACFSVAACKPFTTVVTYIVLGQLCGINIITFWGVELLQLANSSIDPYKGNVCISITRLIFGIITAILLYRLPRTTMAFTSAIGLGLASLILGIYLHLTDEESVIPLALFMTYTVFACLGFYALPFLLMSELYPLQVRGTLNGVSISISNIHIFLGNLCFPYIRDAIGLPNIMLMFGSLSLLVPIFLYCFFPETKDLTLEEIEEYYKKKRSSLISQRQMVALQLKHPNKSIIDDDKEDTNSMKSFVDVTSIASASKSSLSSKKSVTLMIGNKQFKSLTAAEDAELKKELRELESRETTQASIDIKELPMSAFFDNTHQEILLQQRKFANSNISQKASDNSNKIAESIEKSDKNSDTIKDISSTNSRNDGEKVAYSEQISTPGTSKLQGNSKNSIQGGRNVSKPAKKENQSKEKPDEKKSLENRSHENENNKNKTKKQQN